jgi:hypothetical protein
MSRHDLARFILQVAEGSYSTDDWQLIAVNHYQDEKMEEARRKLVRYASGYPAPPNEAHLSLKQLLVAVASELTV